MGIADQDKIKRMQDNLPVIRSVARWTAERLGEEIGVSRQTINSLEHHKTTMTKTQYLALRAVFNHEAMINENTALAQVIQSLVDEPIVGELSEKDKLKEHTTSSRERIDTMDGLSTTTNILADKKLLTAIGAALPTATIPALTSLVINQLSKKL